MNDDKIDIVKLYETAEVKGLVAFRRTTKLGGTYYGAILNSTPDETHNPVPPEPISDGGV